MGTGSISTVTWYSRLLTIVFIFGIFPVLVFVIGKRYQETVTILTDGNRASYELQENDVYFANAAQAGNSAATKKILGEWTNQQDSKYVMKVKDTNIFYEFYEDQPVTAGSWIIRKDLNGTKFSSMPNGTYLQKNILNNKGETETLFYKVVIADGTNLSLSYLENGGALTFLKKGVATSTKNN